MYGVHYMDRYRFLNMPAWLGGWGIRIHHIVSSDLDRELHDHPFDFVSLIICGPGYFEELVDGSVTFYPQFSIVRRRAEDLHRLELTGPVWTIVFRGPRKRRWGFMTTDGWKEAETYMAEKNHEMGYAALTYVKPE